MLPEGGDRVCRLCLGSRTLLNERLLDGWIWSWLTVMLIAAAFTGRQERVQITSSNFHNSSEINPLIISTLQMEKQRLTGAHTIPREE